MDKYIQACVAEAFPGGVHHAYARPAVSELADIVYRAGLTKDKTYSDTALGARFRRITMQCLYVATQVKPDIALAVGLLTRVQAWPNPELLQHAERVLIYLSGVSAVPLRYTKTTDTDLNMMLAPRVAVVPYVTDSASAVYQFEFNLCKLLYPTYLQPTLLLYRIGHSIGSAFECI
jgi:hypothetical protein